MMKRFYFDSADDEGDPEDEEFEMPPEMEFMTMGPMVSTEQYLLSCAVRICERSFMWFFMGTSDRLEMLEKTYEAIKRMTEGEEDAQV